MWSQVSFYFLLCLKTIQACHMCLGGRCVSLCIGDIIMTWRKNIYLEAHVFLRSYFGFVHDKYKEKWNHSFFEECMIILSDTVQIETYKSQTWMSTYMNMNTLWFLSLILMNMIQRKMDTLSFCQRTQCTCIENSSVFAKYDISLCLFFCL